MLFIWCLMALLFQMYHHQGHNNMLSSKAALPPARHLLLQQGGSIPDESGLVLSTDAKPRLKWTPELHDRFIEAVNQLGGADSKYYIQQRTKHQVCILQPESWCFFVDHRLSEATPKTIMRLMGIPGLTLYHLKSHLQVLTDLHYLFVCSSSFEWCFLLLDCRSAGSAKLRHTLEAVRVVRAASKFAIKLSQ